MPDLDTLLHNLSHRERSRPPTGNLLEEFGLQVEPSRPNAAVAEEVVITGEEILREGLFVHEVDYGALFEARAGSEAIPADPPGAWRELLGDLIGGVA